ncbi:lipid A biosynthesis acyltransferase [Chitinibacter bivalviorum]|uniref:Lipid A biosynthesis acyltransferase n=1 Tax=Chitinibacter bivalviorum TaxID=2739434 RepID=A0A7H9BLZ7_9NEIS|nr:lipid A biosynthesis acyltransferase [Chitinibacter bivalviorum]QLG89416.1 lipid A biosynthesis acyltransferase [Chitinibacter bivalviorum]
MKLKLVKALLWLLHWLPFRVMQWIAIPMGSLLYLLIKRRRHIGLTNLQLCFPKWSDTERQRVLRQHFIDMASTILGYSILLHAPENRLRRLIHIEGLEHFNAQQDKAIIMLVPHFLGLDFGGVAYTMDHKGASMYAEQRGVFHDISLQIRSRFNEPVLIKRTDGIRPIVRTLKAKMPFYYLPDQDMGPQQSIFSPFFGVPAATLPMLGKLAEMTHAVVVPVITTVGKGCFISRYYPAWENYPTGDLQADTDRMNQFIEQIATAHPSQYYWLHRRFKTRPEGEPILY